MMTQQQRGGRISIVTAVYNGAATIADCLASVRDQTVPVEHVIIDGASVDGTLDIVDRVAKEVAVEAIPRRGVSRYRVVSEPDGGIYDAMNKGIRQATGEIIGILNADDMYAGPLVAEKVCALFDETHADVVFADLVYVRPHNLERIVRYYSGARFTPDKVAWGWMPPHPTFFVRRGVYERFGVFRTDYRIAADYELVARLLVRHRVRYAYLPEVIVRMRTGGVSTRGLRSTYILNREIVRACAENGIPTNLARVYSKYFRKIAQLVQRPR